MTVDTAVAAPTRFAHARAVGRLSTVVVGLVLAAAVWSLVAATGVFPRALFPTIPEIARA